MSELREPIPDGEGTASTLRDQPQSQHFIRRLDHYYAVLCEFQRRILKTKLWILAYAFVTCVAAIVVWIVGHRGIFFYDQSGIFDGGWRLLQGQIIYRDF